MGISELSISIDLIVGTSATGGKNSGAGCGLTLGIISGMMSVMNDATKTTPEVRTFDRDPALPPYAPSYNEEELEAFIEKGTRAWADVPDSVVWVRQIRGDDGK